MREMSPTVVRWPADEFDCGSIRASCRSWQPARAGGLLGAVVWPLQDDGAGFCKRGHPSGAHRASGQGQHRGRTGVGHALQHPQHSNLVVVPRWPGIGASCGGDGRRWNCELGPALALGVVEGGWSGVWSCGSLLSSIATFIIQVHDIAQSVHDIDQIMVRVIRRGTSPGAVCSCCRAMCKRCEHIPRFSLLTQR